MSQLPTNDIATPPSTAEAEAPPLPPVDPATLRLHIDERGRLFVRREGHDDQHVIARRAFPWSKPDEFVSLRSKEGTEVAMLESLSIVPTETRELLMQFLATATFIPKITHIDRVDMQHGYQLWDVRTESGPLQLRVQEREDVRFLSDVRFSVKDAHGNVYEIPNVSALDDHSQRELARVV